MYRPPRPKPRPGSRPLPKYDAPPEPAPRTYIEITNDSEKRSDADTPPWRRELDAAAKDEKRRRQDERTFTALQKARKEVAEIADYVRDDAFDDWVSCCVVEAKTPDEWTQARDLYENYIAHAQHFGRNRGQRKQSVQALATETQWGRMMGALGDVVAKKRRASGMYYSLRCKRAPATTRE